MACTGELGTAASPEDSRDLGVSGAGARSIMPTSGPLGNTPGSSGQTSGSGSTPGADAGSHSATTGALSSPESGASSGDVPSVEGGRGDGGLPCDVQQLLATRCQSCHSSPPVPPAPMALVTYANLVAPSLADMTKSYAQMSVLRMQDTLIPMPPAPAPPATSTEIAVLQQWILAGYPSGSCSLPDAGISEPAADASVGGSTYDGPLVCSSGKTYTSGHGSTMRPGDVCQSCHGFKIAGTVYETEHEPLFCDGVNVVGANVVITDANGMVTTLTVNNVGNFNTNTTIALPFRAKVTYDGGERDMLTPQTTGACNSCHTADGTNAAPGRVMLP